MADPLRGRSAGQAGPAGQTGPLLHPEEQHSQQAAQQAAQPVPPVPPFNIHRARMAVPNLPQFVPPQAVVAAYNCT